MILYLGVLDAVAAAGTERNSSCARAREGIAALPLLLPGLLGRSGGVCHRSLSGRQGSSLRTIWLRRRIPDSLELPRTGLSQPRTPAIEMRRPKWLSLARNHQRKQLDIRARPPAPLRRYSFQRRCGPKSQPRGYQISWRIAFVEYDPSSSITLADLQVLESLYMVQPNKSGECRR